LCPGSEIFLVPPLGLTNEGVHKAQGPPKPSYATAFVCLSVTLAHPPSKNSITDVVLSHIGEFPI